MFIGPSERNLYGDKTMDGLHGEMPAEMLPEIPGARKKPAGGTQVAWTQSGGRQRRNVEQIAGNSVLPPESPSSQSASTSGVSPGPGKSPSPLPPIGQGHTPSTPLPAHKVAVVDGPPIKAFKVTDKASLNELLVQLESDSPTLYEELDFSGYTFERSGTDLSTQFAHLCLALEKQHKLVTLKFSRCGLRDAEVNALMKLVITQPTGTSKIPLPSLKNLDLSRNEFSPKTRNNLFRALKKGPPNEVPSHVDQPLAGSAHIDNKIKVFNDLLFRHFKIDSSNSEVSDTLKELDFNDTSLTNSSLGLLSFKRLPELTELHISTKNVSKEVMASFLLNAHTHQPKLNTVHITSVDGATSARFAPYIRERLAASEHPIPGNVHFVSQ